jgi:serine protease Do
MMRRIDNHRVAVLALCLMVLGVPGAQGQTTTAPKSSAPKSSAPKTSAPKAEETVSRGWLGVYTQELTDELREGISYTGPGVLVSGVVEDSPADKVGVKKGDVITALGTVAVSDPDELADAVRARKSGETVTLKIVRDGKNLTLSPRLDGRPDRETMEFTPSEPYSMHFGDDDHDHLMVWPTGRGRLGVRVEDLNPDLNTYFNAPGGKGALVVEVIDDSPAEKVGIKAGDVITSVAGSKIDDTDDLVRTLGKQEDEKVTVQVSRKGAAKNFEVELESPHYRYRSYMSPDLERDLRRIEPRVRAHVRALEVPDEDLRKDLEELKRELEELKQEIKRKDS